MVTAYFNAGAFHFLAMHDREPCSVIKSQFCIKELPGGKVHGMGNATLVEQMT